MRLKIAGGCVYDPASGWEGEVRDLYIDQGRLVPHLPAVDRVIAAAGRAVLPGGIDLRGVVASFGQEFLRLRGWTPPLPVLGELYASLGYTHVHEPFLTFATAGYVHREMAALPYVDTSASLTVNLRDLDLWLASTPRLAEVGQTLKFLLEQTRALNLRVVEPFVRYRQEHYAHRTLATERALEVLAQLAREENLTLALEASPEVLRARLPEPGAFHLAALAPALAAEDLVDAALGQLARGATGDLGLSPIPALGGPGSAPVQVDMGWFRPLAYGTAADEARVRRGLNLALTYAGPGLAFSAGGPGAVTVKDYPRLFSWLWDRQARLDSFGEDLGPRQFTLAQWVWATRTLPARLLGLKDRGHLSPGARADVALFDLPPEADRGRWGEFLGHCRTLMKAGEVVVDDFSVVRPRVAKATYFRQTGAGPTPMLAELCQCRSFRRENLWVPEGLGGPWVGL
jgi:formylmethanofuran dehydrogenase subunit A